MGVPVAYTISCRARFRKYGVLRAQEVLEVAHIVERPSARQFAGCVNRQTVTEAERMSVLTQTDLAGFGFVDRAVAFAPPTHYVETFQREAGGSILL